MVQGRGTVITGRIEQGIVRTGDEIELVGIQSKPTKSVVTGGLADEMLMARQASSLSCCALFLTLPSSAGVEMFKKQLSEGQAGDNVGLLVRGIKRDDVERGQVACKPGSIAPARKFEGELYALTKEEGGRHTPFFSNYKPQFFFRTADITGVLSLSCSSKASCDKSFCLQLV